MDSRHGSVASIVTAAFVALAGIAVGCSDSNNGTTSHTVSFFGPYADVAGTRGTISLSGALPMTGSAALGQDNSVAVSGALDLPGAASKPIDGVYVLDTGSLSFATGDNAFIFAGQVSGAAATGSSTGPNGPGSFALLNGGTASTVQILCGGQSCDPGACQGPPVAFFLAVGGTATAMSALVGGNVASAEGRRIGDNVSFSIAGTGVDVTVVGTILGSNVGGTFQNHIDDSGGPWNGSSAQCAAALAR